MAGEGKFNGSGVSFERFSMHEGSTIPAHRQAVCMILHAVIDDSPYLSPIPESKPRAFYVRYGEFSKSARKNLKAGMQFGALGKESEAGGK